MDEDIPKLHRRDQRVWVEALQHQLDQEVLVVGSEVDSVEEIVVDSEVEVGSVAEIVVDLVEGVVVLATKVEEALAEQEVGMEVVPLMVAMGRHHPTLHLDLAAVAEALAVGMLALPTAV